MIMSGSMQSTAPETIHVAVAVIFDRTGNVLISRRLPGVHLEGYWEFPGGKVENSENVFMALQRELLEETGLGIHSGRPLIKIPYHYPEKTVLLDTWMINCWEGEAKGLEGQEIRWVSPKDLKKYRLPPADYPIVSALTLPPIYQISPEPDSDLELFIHGLEESLQSGVTLVQLRTKKAPQPLVDELARRVAGLCRSYQARWLYNGDPERALVLGADGVHLTTERLMNLDDRPLPEDFLVGASCHCREELDQAFRINADFAVLGPVNKTVSHPEREPLGLKNFNSLVETAGLPVYALGGMKSDDLETVWQMGGQGVAMIRSGWPVGS